MPLPDDITTDRTLVPGPSGTVVGGEAIIDHEARIAALEAVALPPASAIISGLYYGPLTTLSGWNGPLVEKLAVADYLYAVPFLCPQNAAFNQVGVEVTTPVAGGTLRMGIYNVGADGMPSTLRQEFGTVDCTAAGWRSIPITITLPRGLYWIGGARNATIGAHAIDMVAGTTAVLGYVGTAGTTPRSAFFRTLSPGFTSLPAIFGAVTTVARVDAFQMRAA